MRGSPAVPSPFHSAGVNCVSLATSLWPSCSSGEWGWWGKNAIKESVKCKISGVVSTTHITYGVTKGVWMRDMA